MRLELILLAGMLAVSGFEGADAATNDTGTKPGADVFATFHFAGTEQIAADPNAAKLNEMGALPETAALREQILNQLATAPFRFLHNRIAGSTNDYAALIRPLVEDLLRFETYAEFRGPTNAVPELMLAVRLDDAHAGIWQANLAIVISAWTHIQVANIKGDGFDGWELKKHHNPNVIRSLRAGEWVLFGWGEDDLLLQPGVLQRIKEKQRPVPAAGDTWLHLSADWPGLASYVPLGTELKPTKVELTVQGKKDFIRPQLSIRFAEPLGMSLDSWVIPTNIIHNPIISFTAMRGAASLLSRIPLVKELNANPLPNQLYLWAMERVPFETSVAAPVKNGTNYLDSIQEKMVSMLNSNLPTRGLNTVASWTTNHEILVRGIPIIIPYLKALHEPDGDFLMAGVFPSPPRETPLPSALIDQVLAQTNLVYYDWEITDGRLMQVRGLSQLLLLASGRPSPGFDMTAQKCLEAIRPKLGNCGTTITLSAPNELKLVRNSSIGLTGFELFWLAYLLDKPDFPLELLPALPPRVEGAASATPH